MTTAFNPPPEHDSMREGVYGGPLRRVPWSKAAIAGFVSSLFGCLGVTAVVGLILGIVGIARTSGGRLRGRGLAIAAIPISLILGALSVVGILVLSISATLAVLPDRLEAALRPEAMASGEATEIIRELAASDFNASVSDADLTEWYAALTAKHGRFVKVLPPGDGMLWQRSPGQSLRLVLNGRFVNETVDILITLRSESRFGPVRMNDIVIGGLSPRSTGTDPNVPLPDDEQ